MEMGRVCSMNMEEEEEEEECILVGKTDGKRPVGRLRRRWVNNIKIDLREIEWDGMDWIDLAQDSDSCEHGNEPSGSVKCWEILQ
jgi:hypothetical protein